MGGKVRLAETYTIERMKVIECLQTNIPYLRASRAVGVTLTMARVAEPLKRNFPSLSPAMRRLPAPGETLSAGSLHTEASSACMAGPVPEVRSVAGDRLPLESLSPTNPCPRHRPASSWCWS